MSTYTVVPPEVELHIECSMCGKELEVTDNIRQRFIEVQVTPCTGCAQAEYDRGRDEMQAELNS